jgi:hypothetical protein
VDVQQHKFLIILQWTETDFGLKVAFSMLAFFLLVTGQVSYITQMHRNRFFMYAW